MDKWLVLLIASIISGILYRLGGQGKPFKSWMRDWLCPACLLIPLLFFWKPSVWWGWFLLLPTYGLIGVSLSTYWDWLFKFDNYWFSGFICGIALFPLAFAGLHWWAILTASVVLAILWGVWCKVFGNDIVEEVGRGLFLVFPTTLLLLI